MRNLVFVLYLGAAVTVMGACGSEATQVSLESVTPQRLSNEIPSEVTLGGTGFELGLQVMFDDDDGMRVDDAFRVWVKASGTAATAATIGPAVSPGAQRPDLQLVPESIRWVDTEHLRATIPAGLAPGIYDVTVQVPGGSSATKHAALVVFAPIQPSECVTDADCKDTDPCTTGERCMAEKCLADSVEPQTLYLDRDGDGFGDSAAPLESCVPVVGYSDVGGDCDDLPGSCGAGCQPVATLADGCDGFDNNCDGSIDEDSLRTTWFQDRDGDGYGNDEVSVQACMAPPGYIALGGDCEDDPIGCGTKCQPSSAPDICDGYDNDCDGQFDEDPAATTWFRDRDGDGAGDPNDVTNGCVAPLGYVATGDDCDDDPSICGAACSPSLTSETCDSYDNNCDGEVDEGLDATWYPDVDGDGAGDDSQPVSGCQQPAGYVALGGDCDDDPGACGANCSPSLVTETCDGYDNNCDGNADEGLAQTWYPDADGDGFGPNDAAYQACAGASGDVLQGGDCDDEPTGCGAACSPDLTTETCDGYDNNCDGNADEGLVQTFFLDVDGDGVGDTASAYQACEGAIGSVTMGGDCDDDPNQCGVDCTPGGASDTCDGFDNDCDGETDEDQGLTTWFQDVDGDGFGTAATALSACVAPTGFVSAAGDCDDDPAVCGASCSPALTAEVCDGFDNDCSALTQDGASEAWFNKPCDGDDSDQCEDGVVLCDAGDIVCSDNATSSAESDATNTCKDGIDNDCDGDTDDADPECSVTQQAPPALFNKSSTRHKVAGDRTEHVGTTHRFDGFTPFSISLWCKRSQGALLPQTLWSGLTTESPKRGYWLNYTSGSNPAIKLKFQADSNNLVSAQTSPGEAPGGNDVWQHVVATYDGSGTAAGIQIYVDGTAMAMTQVDDTFTGPLSTDQTLYIGTWSDFWAGEWVGNIDETTLWSKVLSDIEVGVLHNGGVPISPLETAAKLSVLSWWRHGDDNGTDDTIMVDQVGDNDGVLMGNTIYEGETPGQ